MQNDKESIISLLDKQRECEFSLKFLLQKEESSWKNFFTMLKLVKKGTRKESNYDYKEFVFREKILDFEEGVKLISDLYPRIGEKGRLTLEGYDEFEVERNRPSNFVPSKYRYGIIRNHIPLRFIEFHINPNQISQRVDRELLKEGCPYYPDLREAVLDFFDLGIENLGSTEGSVYVVIPDYRARIESLKLVFSRAELTLVSPEIEHENLVVKVFAKSGARIVTLPDIQPKYEVVKFDIGFQPDILFAALISCEDSMKIDMKEFNKWSTPEEGIFIERPEEEIISLTKVGESQT